MMIGTSELTRHSTIPAQTPTKSNGEWVEIVSNRRPHGHGKPATVSVNKTSVQIMIRTDKTSTDFNGRVLIYVGKGGKVRLVRTNQANAGFKARVFNNRIWVSVAKSVFGEGAEVLRGVYTVEQDGPFAVILTPEARA